MAFLMVIKMEWGPYLGGGGGGRLINDLQYL